MPAYLHESPTPELKRELTDSFLKTVSAYANYGSGKIVFGVDDRGTVLGIPDADDMVSRIEQKIRDTIDPIPDFTFEIDRTDRTITLTVHKGPDTPYLYSGRAYKRDHLSTRPVDRLELARLSRDGLNLDFDALPTQERDLSFRTLENTLHQDLGIEKLTPDVLRSLGLLTASGQYTNAAAILADLNRFPGIRWQRLGASDDEIREKGDLSGMSALAQLEEMTQIFSRHYISEHISGPPQRIKAEDVPQSAFREAVANGLVHRTWNVPAPIIVSMYSDRLEIISPGGLSPDEYFDSDHFSVLRNPTLGSIFFRLGLIERLGTGVRRIRSAYADYIQKPTFKVTENSVRIVLPVVRSATDPLETAVLQALETAGSLSRRELEEKTGLSRAEVLRVLRSLQQAGAVKSSGRARATRYAAVPPVR